MKCIPINKITGASADSENVEYPATNVLTSSQLEPWIAEDQVATLAMPVSGGSNGIGLVEVSAIRADVWAEDADGNPVIDDTGTASDGTEYRNRIKNSHAMIDYHGALPGWSLYGASGISVSRVGEGDGYVDFRIFGTSTVAAGRLIAPHSSLIPSDITAVFGETWTASINITLLSGSSMPSLLLALYARTITGTIGASYYSGAIVASGDYEKTAVLSYALTAAVSMGIRIDVAVGTSVDATIRVSEPQLTKTSTKMTYVRTTYGITRIDLTGISDYEEWITDSGVRRRAVGVEYPYQMTDHTVYVQLDSGASDAMPQVGKAWAGPIMQWRYPADLRFAPEEIGSVEEEFYDGGRYYLPGETARVFVGTVRHDLSLDFWRWVQSLGELVKRSPIMWWPNTAGDDENVWLIFARFKALPGSAISGGHAITSFELIEDKG